MFKRCTESKYWDQLGQLPPAYMDEHGFLMGEPYDHRVCTATKVVLPVYAAFLFFNGKFYESQEAYTIPEYKRKILPLHIAE